MPYTTLTPRLIVDDAEAALEFYKTVFDAVPGMMIKDDDGKVLHAELDMAGLTMSLTEADGELNQSPTTLGGSPTLLTLVTDDPDAIQRKAVAAGGTVIFEVADRFYGARDGRFSDPTGHLWLVTKMVEQLSEAEIQSRT